MSTGYWFFGLVVFIYKVIVFSSNMFKFDTDIILGRKSLISPINNNKPVHDCLQWSLGQAMRKCVLCHMQRTKLQILGGWAGRWCWIASSAGRPATSAYSKARACCASSRCMTGGLYVFFYVFHLSSLSNVLSFGRQLNMTEILWFWLLNPNGSCQLLQRTSLLITG